MVGALERLPASELIPTKKKEPIVPIKAAIVACLKEIPKPKKKAPYDSASKETLAPAHGQNSERAFPERSDSSMTFAPFNSKSNLGISTVSDSMLSLQFHLQTPGSAHPTKFHQLG